MNYSISYPSSGNQATRYILERLNKQPINELMAGEIDTGEQMIHHRYDFKGIHDTDFVIFLIRQPLECIVRHNFNIKGVAEHLSLIHI